MPTLLVLRDLIHIFGEDAKHPDNPGKLAFLMKEVLTRHTGDEYWNMNRTVHKLVTNEEEMIKFFQSYTGWDGTFPFVGYVDFTIKSQ